MLTIEVVTAPLFSMCYFSSELQQTEAVNACPEACSLYFVLSCAQEHEHCAELRFRWP